MAYLNSNDEKIIDLLISAGYSSSFREHYSIRQISSKTGTHYPNAYESIMKLSDLKILNLSKISKSVIASYNFNEVTVGSYIEGLKAKEFLIKYPKIKNFINLFEKYILFVSYSIILFGSYAKGTQNKDSDLDLIVLVDESNLERIERNFNSIKDHSTLNIDVHFFSYKEFIEMLKEAPKVNIATEAYRNHIILSGAENYMNCLKEVQNEKG